MINLRKNILRIGWLMLSCLPSLYDTWGRVLVSSSGRTALIVLVEWPGPEDLANRLVCWQDKAMFYRPIAAKHSPAQRVRDPLELCLVRQRIDCFLSFRDEINQRQDFLMSLSQLHRQRCDRALTFRDMVDQRQNPLIPLSQLCGRPLKRAF